MREKEQGHYQLATMAAEAMCFLLEVECGRGECDLNAMMRRLKDLSAYSLTHAKIMDLHEGVELLAQGKFFGMTGDARFRHNQERLNLISAETFAYQGQAETIVQEVAARNARDDSKDQDKGTRGLQPRLF